MMLTNALGVPRAYRKPFVAAPSSVRSGNTPTVVPSGNAFRVQSALRKPAVTCVWLIGALLLERVFDVRVGGNFSILVGTVDLIHPADVDVLNDVAGLRV